MTENESWSTYAILGKIENTWGNQPMIAQIKARVLLVMNALHLMEFVHVMVPQGNLKIFDEFFFTAVKSVVFGN